MDEQGNAVQVIELAPQTEEMFARCIAYLRPPPALTLSQWADKYRMLSAESSPAAGHWHTDNAPYQREIMDAIGDPHVRKVVIMTAAQIGKTAILMNALGYYMHYYPCPVMMMEPTIEMGQALSKDNLAPMIRDTPVLRGLVDTKSRYSGNTILKKNFPGGHVTIVGANSPVGLRMRPIKVLLADEVDGYPESAGTEGDPLLLAEKRQTVFWDKKTVIVSTPTTKGRSKIEKEFMESTREEWTVPCPGCGHYQPLAWSSLDFEAYREDSSKPIRYRCERCGELFGEYEWKEQGKLGRFRAENPNAETRGFHLNTLASSFCAWKDVVDKFISAKEQLAIGNIEEMKTWTNTELGEAWEEPGEQIEMDKLIPYFRNPTTDNRVKAQLFTIGVDEGKEILHQRLQHTIRDPKITGGPNYCHFPLNPEAGYDETYFKGLTSEMKITRFRRGKRIVYWDYRDTNYKRNEPWDLRNYATAAVEIYNPPILTQGQTVTVKRRTGRRKLNGGI